VAAKQVSELMLHIGKQLDGSLHVIQSMCTPDEFKAYRQCIGKIMGEILLSVLNPLYAEHPALKPEELD
jgi:hypothetical protein